jgi:anti-sigma B factor antagonist
VQGPDYATAAHANDPGVVPDLLAVNVARNDDEVVLTLVGELDIATGERVREVLDGLQQSPPGRLVIDLSQLSFLDSTGLALFVALDKRCRENGAPTLEIRPGPPAVQRLFELIGAAGRLPFSTADIAKPVS